MRSSGLLLLLLASCTAAEPERNVPAPKWVYEPPLPVWQTGESRGRFGRSQAPQLPATGGIVGDVAVPLRAAAVWPLPGEPARAVVYGLEGGVPAIEVADIDAGRILWRSATACVEPVIGVTARTIVCGGSRGVRGVSFDGQPTWKTEEPLRAITGTRVVVDLGKVLDADTGKELAPAGGSIALLTAKIVGSCDGELFVFERDLLARIAGVKGKPGMTWFRRISESEPPATWEPPLTKAPVMPSLYAIDAIDCAADPILVAASGRGARSLIAIARATGKTLGRIEGVRGWWHARDGSDRIEVATAGGTGRWTRDLTVFEDVGLPPLGELLHERGERRLVRSTPLTAVVLDARGIQAFVPLAADTGALGGRAIVGVSGAGGVVRVPLPRPPDRAVRVPPRKPGVALPAELRDLPEPTVLAGTEIAKPDTGRHGIAAIALDAAQPKALYVATLEEETPGPTTSSPIARVDLGRRVWDWQRTDGCALGVPVGLALARDIVACATRGTESTVRATSRDGKAAWDWIGARVDAITGAGDAVLVFDAVRVTVLDAASGKVRGRLASTDGAPMRATAVEVSAPGPLGGEATATTWLVTYERGRLVARLPSASMIAVWSLGVDGVVVAIAPSSDGVLVTLDDGDAYRVALPSATVTAMPGLGLAWRATGELVTGETDGGPIYGEPLPPPVRPRLPFVPGQPAKPLFDGKTPESPTLWIPIPAPDPIATSWQYTLYDLGGGLRARNDYQLSRPVISPRVRGPGGSPLVVMSGTWEATVVDPRTGDPLRRVTLPDKAPGLVFGTIVDGKPVAGTVLASPLRVVLF